jgi:hypothetical protein
MKNSANPMKYKVMVGFKQYLDFSKGYTYLSDKEYKKDDLVLVHAGNWYSVGKVESCSDLVEKDLDPHVKYKAVIQKVEVE